MDEAEVSLSDKHLVYFVDLEEDPLQRKRQDTGNAKLKVRKDHRSVRQSV